MIKKIFYLGSFLLLANCAGVNSAFLGPIYTGAKTGSYVQSSFSFGSGKIIRNIAENEIFNKPAQILSDKKNNDKNPTILLAYAVDNVEISEVFEPEPLP